MNVTAAQAVSSGSDAWWLAIGLFGQGMFFMRFVVQWIKSERAKESVIPEAFWYFSLAGGLIVLVYGIHKQEWVLIVGQAAGTVIYLRNLYFIRRRKRELRAIEAKAQRS